MLEIRTLLIVLLISSSCSCGVVKQPDQPNQDHRANSPSLADVRAAISNANPGDTVLVPAGSATWTSNLVITKGIILKGAGQGQTIITSGYAGGTDYMDTSYFLVSYVPLEPANNETFRISGFTFDFDNKCGGIFIQNTTRSVINRIRIDHNHFQNNRGQALHVYGNVFGVADNNDWNVGIFRINGLDRTTWANFAYEFGSVDNFWIEDNTIRFTTDGDTPYIEMGGRLGFRYNTCTTTRDNGGMFDLHDNNPTANSAAQGAEVYENNFDWGTYGLRLTGITGGKSLWYNNHIISSGYCQFGVAETMDDNGNHPACSPINGQPQHVSDTYIFNNTINGATVLANSWWPYINQSLDYTGLSDPYTLSEGFAVGVVPRENVHFWKQVSSFNGSVGVGVGPFSSRPSSCTGNRVAYWATDTNTLYRWLPGSGWQTYYKPYTYPHPLRSDPVLGN